MGEKTAKIGSNMSVGRRRALATGRRPQIHSAPNTEPETVLVLVCVRVFVCVSLEVWLPVKSLTSMQPQVKYINICGLMAV